MHGIQALQHILARHGMVATLGLERIQEGKPAGE
jgi:hypothetical protein